MKSDTKKIDQGTEESVNPVLANWCLEKFCTYSESYSGRKGLPRKGQKPFSPEKYYATLLALISQKTLPLIEVAEICSVSHSVLKIWRIEKRFQSQVEENIEEYSRYFTDKYLNEDKPESLKVNFSSYDLDLQIGIMRAQFDTLPDKQHVAGEFGWILHSINELFQITLEIMNQEKPIKRSTLYQLCYLQNVQMMILHKGRLAIFEQYKEEVTKKRKNQEDIDSLLEVLDYIDKMIESNLNERIDF